MSMRDVLGARLGEFTELSRRHGDGWGVAWHDESDRLEVQRAPEPAYRSAAYADLLQSVRSRAMIVHLRWATLGYPVSLGNTHPFIAEGVAFCHNGSIRDGGALQADLSPAALTYRRGTTDSERYFLKVITMFTEYDAEQALINTVREVKAQFPYTSLNCLLLTASSVYALADYDADYARQAGEPQYFDLRYFEASDHVVIASQGWPQPRWKSLTNGHLLTIDRTSLTTSVAPLTL